MVEKIEKLFQPREDYCALKSRPFLPPFLAQAIPFLSKMSTSKTTPRFAALYKNLSPSVLATSAYSLRKAAAIKAAEKAAAKAAAIKAAEAAIAPKLVAIMSMKAYEAACKNAQAPVAECDYDEYDYEEYLDHVFDYDW